MRVDELITALSKYPGDAEVRLGFVEEVVEEEGEADAPVGYIEFNREENVVLLMEEM